MGSIPDEDSDFFSLSHARVISLQSFICYVQSPFCCFTCHMIEREEKKLREASLAASSRLKRALLKEKETKDSLQKALNEIQVWVALFWLVCLIFRVFVICL